MSQVHHASGAAAGEPGFVTLYPCGSPRPTASNLNHTAGQTIANAVVVKLGTNGKVCVYNHALTHMLALVPRFGRVSWRLPSRPAEQIASYAPFGHVLRTG